MEKMQIKIHAFDSTLVDQTSIKIVKLVESEGGKVSGPVPLPTRRERFTILRSVHVNKKSREQFEMRTHKRLIVIEKMSDKLADGLKRFKLPAGVNIEVITK